MAMSLTRMQNMLGSAVGGQLGGLGINYQYLQHQMLDTSGTSTVWNIGYSPSANTLHYYQSQQSQQPQQSNNGTILERLRSEIKNWHGEVLKV